MTAGPAMAPRHEVRVLSRWAGWPAIGIAALPFCLLAASLGTGMVATLDRAILLALRDAGGNPLGPWWLVVAARDVTSLGSVTVLILLALAAIAYCLTSGARREAGVIAAAFFGGVILNTALKHLVARARPDLVNHEVTVYTPSFPSAHAMLTATLFLVLGALAAAGQSSPLARGFVLATAVCAVVVVGVSRVFLGVHWPSDVLAGWSAGTAWALVCLRLLAHRPATA